MGSLLLRTIGHQKLYTGVRLSCVVLYFPVPRPSFSSPPASSVARGVYIIRSRGKMFLVGRAARGVYIIRSRGKMFLEGRAARGVL